MLPLRQVNLVVLFASPVVGGSFLLAWDLRMKLEQGLCVILSSSRHLQNVCHQNENKLSLPQPFGQNGNNTVMLAMISFSSRLGFLQFNFMVFSISVTDVCKDDEKWEGKNSPQT